VELKRCNYLISKYNNSAIFAIAELIELWDLLGKNIKYLYPVETNNIGLINCSKMQFESFSDFNKILSKNSNFFRIDLIVIDLWKFNLNSVSVYKEVLEEMNIDYVIICSSCYYKETDDINLFDITKEKTGVPNIKSLKYNYIITEKQNGASYSIDDLYRLHIRNKKIDDIIDV
jgi:hypothetical protein